MLYYPQLETGTVCQYPLTRSNSRRTIANALADGSDLRVADFGAASIRWDLNYSQLTTCELSGIQGLFDAASGSWQTFTFLDPADNLLTWSEDPSKPGWERDPLLTLGSGLTDPFGGTGGVSITNTGQVAQELQQPVAGPSWFQYCLSVYVRSSQATTIDLYSLKGSERIERQKAVGSMWSRLVHPFRMTTKEDGLSAGIRLEAGQSVVVFGFQLEAQSGAGGYKKTRDRGGVYDKARFDQDTLLSRATGFKQHACAVKIVSNVAG